MAFGTDFSYEEAIDILQYQFGAEGWSAQIAPSDYSLHTMSRDQRSCMVFFPEPTSVPDASSGGSNSQEYEAVVGVVIDGCGTR